MSIHKHKQHLAAVFVLLISTGASAWGPDGHRVVGALALDQLSEQVHSTITDLMGTENLDELTQWCNWPDEYRGTDEGAWTYPLHYVNIHPEAGAYDRARDCRDDLCVTEAIPVYVEQLGNTDLDLQTRQRAFGFVCHFVGDLSQPLHAGYPDDRGGNDFEIEYHGEAGNLHGFFDSILITERSESWNALHEQLRERSTKADSGCWHQRLAVDWTEESHQLVRDRVYPRGSEISDEFADQTWELIQQRLVTGGKNLWLVLNAALAAKEEPRVESKDESD